MPSPHLGCVMVTVPPLLAAVFVQAVSPSVDLHVLANLGEREGLAERLPPLDPELVVIGLEPGEDDAIGAALLRRLPRAKILLISANSSSAIIHEMRPHRTVLIDFSPANLRKALLSTSGPAAD